MSVLIKGMGMPKAGTTITIYELEGQLYASEWGTELAPLVEVPTPHGRLIDADALIKYVLSISKSDYNKACILQQVDFAPTVLEAEE